MLIRIPGGIRQALCAEPAVSAFKRQAAARKVTVCSGAADLYVGHPSVDGIMYAATDAKKGFEHVVDLAADSDDPLNLMHTFAEQLSVAVEGYRPRFYVTDMDRLRMSRFGVKAAGDAGVVIVLPEGQQVAEEIATLAADIEERLGTGVILIGGKRQAQLRCGLDLTGRLMPREMMAVLSRAAWWIGFDGSAAAMGWTAGRPGIVFTEDEFKSPDAEICMCKPYGGPETQLERISELFAGDGETG